MTATTPDQQIVRPVGADLADVPTEVLNWLAGVEGRLNLRYTNFADRASRHTVPVEGESSDLAAEDRSDSYNGTAWISSSVRGRYAHKFRATNAAAVNNSTVLVADSTLTVTLGEANRTFKFGGRIYYDGSAAGDLKLALIWPAGTTLSKWGGYNANITTATNLERPVTAASGGTIAVAGLGVGTTTFIDYDGIITLGATTGSLQIQYAQQAADATNLTIQAGSELWVECIA